MGTSVDRDPGDSQKQLEKDVEFAGAFLFVVGHFASFYGSGKILNERSKFDLQ
jgi:hypothetical protein